MENYANKNAVYWQGRYNAPNVESFIFRFYGRILRHDYGIDGSNGEKILDFGCGEGGALRYSPQSHRLEPCQWASARLQPGWRQRARRAESLF